MTIDIRMQRAYDPPHPDGGTRILVERLWPRGLSKERAQIDVWPKRVAPSTALRRWYQHTPDRWEEFRRRYREELARDNEDLDTVRTCVARGRVTFVFGSREERRNSAAVLKQFIEEGANP